MKERNQILKYLEENNVEHKETLKEFINSQSEIYLRSNLIGHITGSAFIINNEMDKALLILHKKYNKWLAPGGHTDEGETARMSSERESEEEVGLNKLDVITPEIFDIDIHRIPESNKNGVHEPEHWHFDIRYIYKAQVDAIVDINLFEAKGFEWNKLSELSKVSDPSVKRMADKAILLVDNLKPKVKVKFKT